MRKITLLAVMLVCFIGFGQNSATFVSGSTSVNAVQQSERMQPSTEVQAILDRISEVGTVPFADEIIVLTSNEKALLLDYYGQNKNAQIPGDVNVLNLRAPCGNDFGSFPLTGPFDIVPVTTNTNPIFSGDMDDTGTIYAMDNDALTLITIDPATGAETTVGPLTNLVAGHNTRGIAWNEANTTMYLLSGAGDDVTLYSVDRATGTLTEIGTSTFAGIVGIWLAIDNSGNAFMADIGTDNLFSMDLTTGTATLVGALGINISFAQDADFDPVSGTLFMAAYIGGGVNFWASVDTTTGTVTTLGSINTDCCEGGIISIEGASGGGGGVCPAPVLEVNQDIQDTCMANISQGGLAQSYIALEPISAGAGVEFVSVSTGENVNLSLWDDLPTNGGTMLASASALTDGVNTFTDVLWDPVVNVTVGNTYYIVIDGDTTLPCVAGSIANPYAGGSVFANGFTEFPNFDYTFRTFSCGGGGPTCDVVQFDATGLPSDIDPGGTSTADCAGAPNLYAVTVGDPGTIGVDSNIDNVTITITHTFDGDLDIYLVSPTGTELILSDQNGGSGDNYIDTVFMDGGADITLGTVPFTGTFAPEGGTFAATFDGEDIQGDWQLKICDNFGGDTGTVDSFSLSICRPEPPTNDECVDAFTIACGDVVVGETTTDTDSGGNAAPDEWYSFTGSGSPQIVTLSLCDGGTDYDSL
ncbi:MAG: proprotein convertase P-domain-containing protein, partial [Flavobacteriaceae bacterium]|nr:proprotein convertase P-domain-containing protein [Flavobacteriaceae bacterium]